VSATSGGGDRVDAAGVRLVSPNLFDVLGVTPHAGRTFTAASALQEAVVSYRVWQRVLDARPEAIGTVLWIDSQPYTVVGVMPERFWVGAMSSPIWLALDPLALAPGDGLEVIARRPPDITPAMLDARLQAGLAEYTRQLPAADRELRLHVSGIEGTPAGHQIGRLLHYVLATAVLLTLLIACANVAVLMIAQWTAREHELAIRASIGASRGRIVRALVTESVLIAACGGTLGIGATLALAGWVARRSGDGGFFDLSIDPRIFAQAAALTLLAGVLAGIAPALYETRRLQANPLRTLGGSDRVRQRWRSALVVFEITVTVALLVVTVSMVDGYQRARSAQIGYATRPLLIAWVEDLSGAATSQILQTLQHLPGVSGAAASASSAPPFMGGPHTHVAADAAGATSVGAQRTVVSAGFFSAIGVPIRAGRAFSGADLPTARNAIVNETLARRLFPGDDPVGRLVWDGELSYEIVGVAADYASTPMQSPATVPRLFVLLPADSDEVRRMHFVIRAEDDPAALVQSVRRELHRMAPGRVAHVNTVDQILNVMGQEILARHSALASSRQHRHAPDELGHLRHPCVYHRAAVPRAGCPDGHRRDRCGPAPTDWLADQQARHCRHGPWRRVDVRPRSDRAGGRRWQQRLRSIAPAFIIPVLLVAAIAVIATWVPSRRARRIDPAALLRSN
jgi:putative ABC transport system permease protein